MRRTLLIISLLSFLLLVFLTESAVSDNDEAGNYSGSETVKIVCTQNRDTYKVVCKYQVYGKRSLALVVQDRKKMNRRVRRTVLQPGSGTLNWKGKKSRYPDLVKAGVTILDYRNSEVVASDEDYF